MSTNTQTPEYMAGIVGAVIRAGRSELEQRMLDNGEDVTDTELWKHRREQFLGLLADRAAER